MVTVTGRHSGFFTFSRVGNEVTLSMAPGTTLSSLPNEQYLQVSIVATAPGLTSASSKVIISIPFKGAIGIFEFAKFFYAGVIDNRKQLSLEPMEILSDKTIVGVELTGFDSSYFSVTYDSNIAFVNLKADISEDVFLTKNVLNFNIRATNSEADAITAGIFVVLPRITEDKILRFEKSTYIGSYDAVAESINIEIFVLELSNYNEDVKFLLRDRDADFFELTRTANSVSLKLKSDFDPSSMMNKVFLSLNIRAERVDFASAEAAIFIHLPVKVELVELISFTKVNYRGSVDHKRTLTLEDIHLHPNPRDGDILVEIKGEDSEKFTLNRIDDAIKIKLNSLALFEPKNPFYFFIEALKFGVPKVQASIVIDFIDKIHLKLDELRYVGQLDKDFELTIASIPLNDDMKSSGVTVQLRDGDSEFFSVEKTAETVQIRKRVVINESILKNRQIMWFYLEASGADFYSTQSLVLIELPIWSSVPVDECYDVLDQTQPIFETGSYSLTFTSEEIGLIGRIRAFTIAESGTLTYLLRISDPYIYGKISIANKSGELRILVPLPVGTYQLLAHAVSGVDSKTADTRLTLRVIESKECVGDAYTTVQKTLAVQRISENQVYDQIMAMNIDGCAYEIVSVAPDGYRSE